MPEAGAEVTSQVSGARGVVVLGMGRSGTSSVTRMFQRSGYFVGAVPDLLGPDAANPTGYFENRRVWRANEDVLARLGGLLVRRSGRERPARMCR